MRLRERLAHAGKNVFLRRQHHGIRVSSLRVVREGEEARSREDQTLRETALSEAQRHVLRPQVRKAPLQQEGGDGGREGAPEVDPEQARSRVGPVLHATPALDTGHHLCEEVAVPGQIRGHCPTQPVRVADVGGEVDSPVPGSGETPKRRRERSGHHDRLSCRLA